MAIPSKTFEEFGKAWFQFVSDLQGTVYYPGCERWAKHCLVGMSDFPNMQLNITEDVVWIMDEWNMIPCDAENLTFEFDRSTRTLVIAGAQVNTNAANQVYTIEEMLTSDSEILRKVAGVQVAAKLDLDFEITCESKGQR